jgi:hypothetical protein
MSHIAYVRERAERAERLAKAVMDRLTVKSLRAFAAECQSQADTLSTSKEENAAA